MSRAVPMKQYSSNPQPYQNQQTIASPSSNTAGAPASMSMEALKQMTSLRLAAGLGASGAPQAEGSRADAAPARSGYVPAILTRRVEPKQAPVLNPHSQVRPQAYSQTPLSNNQAEGQRQGQFLSHSWSQSQSQFNNRPDASTESSVLMRSTSNIIQGNSHSRDVDQAMSATLSAAAKNLSIVDSATFTTECNTPESSYYAFTEQSTSRFSTVNLLKKFLEPIRSAPPSKPASEAEHFESEGSQYNDEDSVEALLAEATNLSAFNFSDSAENTIRGASHEDAANISADKAPIGGAAQNGAGTGTGQGNAKLFDRILGRSHR